MPSRGGPAGQQLSAAASMPIRQRVEPHRRRVEATIFGEVTITDILEAISSSVADPEFQPGFNVLFDHTQITKVITTEQVEEMVEHLDSLSESMAGARWAVVTSLDASCGMMRMLSVLAERVPMEVGVFRNAEEAKGWLRSPRREDGPARSAS